MAETNVRQAPKFDGEQPLGEDASLQKKENQIPEKKRVAYTHSARFLRADTIDLDEKEIHYRQQRFDRFKTPSESNTAWNSDEVEEGASRIPGKGSQMEIQSWWAI